MPAYFIRYVTSNDIWQISIPRVLCRGIRAANYDGRVLFPNWDIDLWFGITKPENQGPDSI